MPQSAYLPFVDGLRAIAVLFVVAYHTDLGLLPGGFVGVDVFFVISGYLITNQIAGQIRNGSFTFRGFYTRRIRRLIPAFAAVSLATLVAGYFLLLPGDFVYHSKLVGLAFLSVGNFYIANTTGGYFDPRSEEIPLLHSWSLSVEEQYYLIWPLLLILGFRFLGKKLAIPLALLVLAGTLIFSEYQAQYSPDVAYYLLPARSYELLIGSFLALIQHRLPVMKKAPATVLSVIGVLALAWSSLFISYADSFPGYLGLVVCLGTALLIYTGFSANPVTTLLSGTWLVGIGKISYSLYLWHWPVFSFMRYVEGSLSTIQVLFAVAVSFVLSFLSWRYVEIPFRERWKNPFGKTLGYLYLAPLMVIVLFFVTVDNLDGVPDRFGDRIANIQALESTEDNYRERCDKNDSSNCIDILLVGDSHANHYGSFVKALQPNGVKLKLTTNSKAFCPPLLGLIPVEIRESGGQKLVNHECVERNQRFYDSPEGFDYILFSSYWAMPVIKDGRYYFSVEGNEEFSVEKSMQVLRKTLFDSMRYLEQRGITPVMVLDVPTIREETLKCTYKRVLYDSFVTPCLVEETELTEQNSRVGKIFSELQDAFPRISFIDPAKVFCNQKHCDVILDGTPLYRDDDHLNAVGSRLLGEVFASKIGSPFLLSK